MRLGSIHSGHEYLYDINSAESSNFEKPKMFACGGIHSGQKYLYDISTAKSSNSEKPKMFA